MNVWALMLVECKDDEIEKNFFRSYENKPSMEELCKVLYPLHRLEDLPNDYINRIITTFKGGLFSIGEGRFFILEYGDVVELKKTQYRKADIA